MPLSDLSRRFQALKAQRRIGPLGTVDVLGDFSATALHLLHEHAEQHPVTWLGSGDKTYAVYTRTGDTRHWSRGVNTGLFCADPHHFAADWHAFTTNLAASAGTGVLINTSVDEVNRLFYTAAMSFAAAVDLFQSNRGVPGTYFEMLVGPTISVLTGRVERGSILLPLPDSDLIETVPVDLTFEPETSGTGLVVPTKISTRERISQAFVHQRILDTARPGRYRSVLGIVNENNAFHEKNSPKTVNSLYLTDTLVPGTIVLYQRYVSALSGLYYLDPPASYLGPRPGFPPVASFGRLLTADLPALIA